MISSAVAFVFSATAFAALESRHISVTARIENALSVPISGEGISFGEVFPLNEKFYNFSVALSDSFIEASKPSDDQTGIKRIGVIDYMIRQKPKCTDGMGNYGLVTENEMGEFICEDEGYEKLPVICPYLSKNSVDNEENDGGIAAFHGDMDWTMEDTVETQVLGQLAYENDQSDTWKIELKTPCFEGGCGEDWAGFVAKINEEADAEKYMLDKNLKGEDMGCDLWIEVYGIDEENLEIPGIVE